MKFNQNPYYNPSECGLEMFDSIDCGESYEFDIFAIWKKLDDSSLWWDSDSGCSCPIPFDPSEDRHNLNQITKDTLYNFELALKNHHGISNSDYNRILIKVKEYIEL